MPTLLIWRGHKFRFYALDMDEPPHVHVFKDGKTLKIWLQSLEVAKNKGYSDREVEWLISLVNDHRDEWTRMWNEFFGL